MTFKFVIYSQVKNTKYIDNEIQYDVFIHVPTV